MLFRSETQSEQTLTPTRRVAPGTDIPSALIASGYLAAFIYRGHSPSAAGEQAAANAARLIQTGFLHLPGPGWPSTKKERYREQPLTGMHV